MRKADWGYQKERFGSWVDTANAPALSPVRNIYGSARNLGYKVVFLTGRTEDQRSATIRNLRREGMGIFDKLILRPDGEHHEKAVVFKTKVRRNLTDQGHTIVASFGDQASDLEGGYTARTFKIPNPFYKIP